MISLVSDGVFQITLGSIGFGMELQIFGVHYCQNFKAFEVRKPGLSLAASEHKPYNHSKGGGGSKLTATRVQSPSGNQSYYELSRIRAFMQYEATFHKSVL